MTDPGGKFAVDLADLENLILRLKGAIELVDRIAGELDSRATGVQLHWTGSAADAYAATHADWLAAARELNVEITKVRSRAQNAHTSYVASISTNLKMLGRG